MKLVKKLQSDFTIINNKVIRHKGISDKCKGLYVIMISLPDNWRFSVNGLLQFTPSGKDAVASSLREMEKFELLARIKYQDEKGRWNWQYRITDEPAENPTESAENPSFTENPLNNPENNAENPVTAKPLAEKTLIKEELNKEELIIINNNKARSIPKSFKPEKTLEQKQEEKETNDFLKAFSEIDIKNSMGYQNQVLRATCRKLFKTYGKENVYQALELVKLNNQNPQKYFPLISDPFELLSKWSKLKAFFQIHGQVAKEQEEKKNKVLRGL